MDQDRFDGLARRFASGVSRRGVMKGLTAGLAGVFGARSASSVDAQRAGQAAGSACLSARDCASFSCVDGVCCDTPCTGTCEACNVPGSVGTCTPVTGAPVGNRGPCPGEGVCAASCDGQTREYCAGWPGAETTCGASTCTSGFATSYVCAGNGTCYGQTVNCAPSGCNAAGTACASGCASDAECPGDSYCAADGRCVGDQPLGGACTRSEQCQSGYCVDGVCCQTACDGACQTCGATGFCQDAADGGTCGDGGLCCDGGCVDPTSDPRNCGGCDRSCPGIENGRAICVEGTCDVVCLDGYKWCDGACIPNASCCTAADCPAPPNGQATCADGVCGFTCNTGYKTCDNGCIPVADCCTAADCTAPANATATCSGGTCGFTCNTGYKRCGDACIPSIRCCTAADCPAPEHGQGTCTNGTCGFTCNTGFTKCRGICAGSPALPDTDLGNQIAWLIAQMNGAIDTLTRGEFNQHVEASRVTSYEAFVTEIKRWEPFRPIYFGGFVGTPTATSASFLLVEDEFWLQNGQIVIEATGQHRIIGLALTDSTMCPAS